MQNYSRNFQYLADAAGRQIFFGLLLYTFSSLPVLCFASDLDWQSPTPLEISQPLKANERSLIFSLQEHRVAKKMVSLELRPTLRSSVSEDWQTDVSYATDVRNAASAGNGDIELSFLHLWIKSLITLPEVAFRFGTRVPTTSLQNGFDPHLGIIFSKTNFLQKKELLLGCHFVTFYNTNPQTEERSYFYHLVCGTHWTYRETFEFGLSLERKQDRLPTNSLDSTSLGVKASINQSTFVTMRTSLGVGENHGQLLGKVELQKTF